MSCGVGLVGGGIEHFWEWTAADLNNTVAMRWLNAASSGAAVTSVEDGGVVLVSKAGRFTELRVRILTALAAGRDTTFTLRVNGVATALTVTVLGGANAAVVTGSVSVVPGDRVSVSTQVTVADATTCRPRAVVLLAA
jgi:hypothetical protein